MLYTTENVQISLTQALATHLGANGYDVFWQSTGETTVRTGGAPRGTLTLAPEFPANPAVIVRLKRDGADAEAIQIPALVLRVVGGPERRTILGVGHKDYEWRRRIVVDGFASDEFEHRALADLLQDWLASEEWKEFDVSDYSDPANPVLIGPMWVEVSGVDRRTLVNDNEAVRCYLIATAQLIYVE